MNNQYLEKYQAIKNYGLGDIGTKLILEMQSLVSAQGDDFISVLKICAQQIGLLQANHLHNLIYVKQSGLVSKIISAGIVDLSHTTFHMGAPNYKATLEWYAQSIGAHDVVKACEDTVTPKPIENNNQYLEKYQAIKNYGLGDIGTKLILEMQSLVSAQGDDFISVLKICAQQSGLLQANHLHNLIYVKQSGLASKIISAGIVDLSHTTFHMGAPNYKATLEWYAQSIGAHDVVKACEDTVTPKPIENLNSTLQALSTNNVFEKYEEEEGAESIISNFLYTTKVLSSNSRAEIKEFDAHFQKNYVGKLLSGGGNAGIYELPHDPSKIIRINFSNEFDQSPDLPDFLSKRYAYKHLCNLSIFKNKYPELPVAQIDDAFFIHAKQRIKFEEFNKKDITNPINPTSDSKNFYHMATIMEKLVDSDHPDIESDSVRNALKMLNIHKIGIGDYKQRNTVKKIYRESSTNNSLDKLQSMVIKDSMKEENDHISYEVPVFVDYDDWVVPVMGEVDSM